MREPEWSEWVATRPNAVRRICESHPPDRLYRLTTTGQIGSPIAYGEDGTIRMIFPAELNPMAFVDLEVFGLDPADIVEVEREEQP